MITKLPNSSGRLISFRFSGKLVHKDYEILNSQFDKLCQKEQKIRVLIELAPDFSGWELRAGWDDFVFGMKHYSDFERIAVIGDEAWEEWLVKLAKPFTKAQVKFFKKPDADLAWKWLT